MSPMQAMRLQEMNINLVFEITTNVTLSNITYVLFKIRGSQNIYE